MNTDMQAANAQQGSHTKHLRLFAIFFIFVMYVVYAHAFVYTIRVIS